MINLQEKIIESVSKGTQELYGKTPDNRLIQLQKTKKEFEGDITLVVFPLLKLSSKKPEDTAFEIGDFLKKNEDYIENFNVVKGFLNLNITTKFYLEFINIAGKDKNYGTVAASDKSGLVMIEYSSPNTNKPLHLGHIRNNLLGYSLSNILQADGKKVIKTNIVNDRGIHICKSMLAWLKWGNGETPGSSGKKGDHLVGDYYVKFDAEYKKQIEQLVKTGLSEEEAKRNAPLIKEALELLNKWESGDRDTHELWETMNKWVYIGFEVTYKQLGVDFDKIYYESDTYITGKETVIKGLEKKVFKQREDKSVWVDLTNDGLDEKLLLRSDGTSVYITQDIGTARLRQNDFKPDKMIYVVGNEQNYHFKVLALILDKLGFSWAKDMYHLSYGMVELPEGKMKSREGTVVDADDLMDEMINTARDMSKELGKLEGLSNTDKENIFRVIGLGALKYFILKVDPIKNMTFNPRESIDFNGNTGPFIQYTYTRIQSVLRKASDEKINTKDQIKPDIILNFKERTLIKLIYEYPEIIRNAAESYNPALICNYLYEVAKEYNQFYHEFTILKEQDIDLRDFRLYMSLIIAGIIKNGMALLGIETPERM